jgi:hypothetical protein
MTRSGFRDRSALKAAFGRPALCAFVAAVAIVTLATDFLGFTKSGRQMLNAAGDGC